MLVVALLGGSAALAQPAAVPGATAIAVPPLTSPDSGSRGNQMLQVGWEATQLIVADLGQTAELAPLKASRDDYYSYPEVTAPNFQKWRSTGAKLLVTGFVQSRSDGRLTFGCYVYDTEKGREIARKGFVLAPGEWRRAAHRCAGLAYSASTGAPGMFDSRIAYVAETGSGEALTRQIAVMDSDGSNHRYVTRAGTQVLTPRLSPKADRVAFVSYADGKPSVHLLDLGSGQERPLIAADAISFAPRYSPDGTRIVFSMMVGPNSDIYVADANGGLARRLTTSPGVDTDPSFSPDGKSIVFESDRSGSQQLYVMNDNGGGQRRISFGPGAYASPTWSPDGQWIAFTHRGPEGRRIGLIHPDGAGEKLLTGGPADEAPSWAASSRALLFQRADATGKPGLFRVPLGGGDAAAVSLPQPGSDPDWSGAMD
jgi:TolB protein